MLAINATISAWQRLTGERGDSLPLLSGDLIAAASRPPVPCELVNPSSYRRSSERALGNELVWLIVAPREPFRQMVGETLPEPGDRVRIAKTRSLAPSEWFEIVSVIDKDEVLEIGLGKKLDGGAEVDA